MPRKTRAEAPEEIICRHYEHLVSANPIRATCLYCGQVREINRENVKVIRRGELHGKLTMITPPKDGGKVESKGSDKVSGAKQG